MKIADEWAHEFTLNWMTSPLRDWIRAICDTPGCCNRRHLIPRATAAENRADCVRKGRQARGATHGSRMHPERFGR
jgi:hypothetical protein